MPFGYLVTVAVVAWCTVAALAPIRRPAPLGRLAFVSGLAINEVTCVALYFLLASTLLAWFNGDLDTRAGLVVLGLAALTVAGLLALMVRQLAAPRVVDDALAAGLYRRRHGANPSEAIPGRSLRTHTLGRMLFPSRSRRAGVERIANIAYAGDGPGNMMDLYRSRGSTTVRPVLIHLHGGRFSSGRKNTEALPLLYTLAAEGWLGISANYRLQPEVTLHEQLADVKKIIAWVRKHGTDYGADPNSVFLAGASAGATLAALTALTATDTNQRTGPTGVDTSVAGAICLNGYYGPSSIGGTPTSPAGADTAIGLVHSGAPAFFVAHGDNDSVLDVRGARDFSDALRRVSPNIVVYAELPGAQHQFDLFRSLRAEAIARGVQEFAKSVLAGDAQVSP